MITHAMIMGISGVYISWGKSMQSWVYSTLPEEKRTQEPVKQLPRNLLLLPLLEKKKKALSYAVTYLPNAPQNSPENWKQSKLCSGLADSSAQISLLSPLFMNWACQHCQKAQEFVLNHTLH